MAKGGRARERFRARQRYNRIVNQLNQLRSAGFTTEDIRAAGPNAWRELRQSGAPTQPAAAPGATAFVPGTTTPAEALPTGPAGRSGFIGQGGTPKTGPVTPAWWRSQSPFAGVTGMAGGIQTTPNWLQRAMQGAYQGARTVIGGINQPAWLGRTPTTSTQPGTLGTRPVSATWGIPDFPMLTQTGPQFSFGGGGNWYGYSRRRGGGRRRQPRGGTGYNSGSGGYNSGPAWGQGLTNWSIG